METSYVSTKTRKPKTDAERTMLQTLNVLFEVYGVSKVDQVSLARDLVAALDAAAVDEREACAKVAEDYYRRSTFNSRDLVAALDAAAVDEREACAKVAEDYYRRSTFNSRVRSLGQDAADGIAAAIRNRVR